MQYPLWRSKSDGGIMYAPNVDMLGKILGDVPRWEDTSWADIEYGWGHLQYLLQELQGVMPSEGESSNIFYGFIRVGEK